MPWIRRAVDPAQGCRRKRGATVHDATGWRVHVRPLVSIVPR